MTEQELKEICSIKENRHKIYKLAKIYQLMDSMPYSMCWSINHAMFKLYRYRICPDGELLYLLPEFAALKPDVVDALGYWFDDENLEIRLNHFDQLIKATE